MIEFELNDEPLVDPKSISQVIDYVKRCITSKV